MNQFRLFAHGEHFDPDDFLKKTSLKFDKVWRRGDVRGCPGFIHDTHPTSGVAKLLGCGWEIPVHEQDRIAADFLEANQSALRQLAKFPGVETFVLGLHYYIELTPEICGFCMSPSPRLMRLSLLIGLDPTYYVDLDRIDAVDDE